MIFRLVELSRKLKNSAKIRLITNILRLTFGWFQTISAELLNLNWIDCQRERHIHTHTVITIPALSLYREMQIKTWGSGCAYHTKSKLKQVRQSGPNSGHNPGPAPLWPFMGTLKPPINGPLYSNTVIGTLDGWAVTFGTARRGL